MGASPRCPGVIRNATGRPQLSTTAWILSICRRASDRLLRHRPFSASGRAVCFCGGAIDHKDVPIGRLRKASNSRRHIPLADQRWKRL